MPPQVTVIIPAFNEEARLGATLDRVVQHPRLDGAQIVVVDDGSTDATVAISEDRLRDIPFAHTLRSPSNKGKGAAIRKGMVVAGGDKVLFMDADLATSLDAIDPMLDRLDEADVVVGSRNLNGSVVTGRSRGRAVMHRAFSGPARQIAGLGVSDPQCGFKGFRREIVGPLFRYSLFDGFSIDVEILLIAQKMGLRIEEIPVVWHAVQGSKVRVLRDPLHMAADLARVRYRHRDVPRHVPAASRDVGDHPRAVTA
ncbi:MAG: dolichyl-phosphate beta-glucosyltransferase [Solirubrobacteraceae bacterium]|nr:glycosyltransferase family 2 protein [Patulibacter sp.]